MSAPGSTWIATAREVLARRTAAFVDTVTGARIDPTPRAAYAFDGDDAQGPVVDGEQPPEGVWLDMQTANALVVVHDNLGAANRLRFIEMPLVAATRSAWRVLALTGERTAAKKSGR